MRILFDIDVLLDVLLARDPFVVNAARLLNAVELGQIDGYLAPHAITPLHYLVAKKLGQSGARDVVARLLRLFSVAVVNQVVYYDALQNQAKDFEDAVQAATAHHLGLDGIVTRNLDDYRRAGVKTYSPTELVAWLARQQAAEEE